MKKIEEFINKVIEIFIYIAGISIFLMMLITTIDVIGRQFKRPLVGAYELVSFLSVIAIAFALAFTTKQKAHISVNIITRLLPQLFQNILNIIANILCLFFLYFLCEELYYYAVRLMEKGEVSLTLKIPFYYFIFFSSFAVLVVCLYVFLDIIKNFIRIIKK